MSSERDISPRETFMNKGNDSLSSFLSHQAVKRIAIFVKFIHWLIYLLTGPRQHFGVARRYTELYVQKYSHACMHGDGMRKTYLALQNCYVRLPVLRIFNAVYLLIRDETKVSFSYFILLIGIKIIISCFILQCTTYNHILPFHSPSEDNIATFHSIFR